MAVPPSELTVEVPAPELRAAEAHRKLAAQEKREKKLARVRVKKVKQPKKKRVVATEIRGEKSGIRKKKARKTAPPPVPRATKRARSAPPPIPMAARRPSIAPPPPPSKSIASFAPPAPPKTLGLAPEVAKVVVHIPSREQTRQFPLPADERKERRPSQFPKRREVTRPNIPAPETAPSNVIPLARVAPVEIAVPLVPTAPMPLTRKAPASVTMVEAPVAAAFMPAASRNDGRPSTQQILTQAPAPFSVEDPNEDLLAPYKKSPIRSISRALSSLFD